MELSPWKKSLCQGRKAMTKLESILKSRDITLLTKFHIVKAMVFPVVVYRCESWTIKKVECWRTDAFELWCWRRLLRAPWTARRSKQSILLWLPLDNQPWIFIGRTDVEAEAPIPQPLNMKSWLIGKDLDAGKDWGQEKKGTTEDKMFGWHHWFNGHEFEQTPRDNEAQGGMVCCSPWNHKQLDVT